MEEEDVEDVEEEEEEVSLLCFEVLGVGGEVG